MRHDGPTSETRVKREHITEVAQGEVRQDRIEHKFGLATNKPRWTEMSYCIHADIQTRAHAALKIPKTNAACRLKYLLFWWDVTPRHLAIGTRRFATR
jgi:hypothetical protein